MSFFLSPSRTVVTSFTPRRRQSPVTNYQLNGADAEANHAATTLYDDGDWVLCVTANHSTSSSSSSSTDLHNGTSWIGCALSNGQVHVYDTERLHLTHCYEKVHGGGADAIVTDITTHPSCPHVLVTSGTDGRVCFFDLRQQQQQQQQTQGGPALSCTLPRAPQEQALSVALGYQGQLVAVGSNKAQVHFFDVRQTGHLLGSYVDAHTEEVTRLQFQPHHNSTLLATGSEDGLVCTFDTSQPSEELALKSVLNVQSPIRQVRFFGPNYEGLCCLTGSETMSVWHHDAAQRIHDYMGLDLRQHLSQQTMTMMTMKGHNSGAAVTLYQGMALEYLVDCHWNERQQQLYLLAGNPTGDAALFQVHATGTLQLSNTLGGGHKGVIRGWCPLQEYGSSGSGGSGMSMVTVGEDARLCEWKDAAVAAGGATSTMPSVSMASAPPAIFSQHQPVLVPGSFVSAAAPHAITAGQHHQHHHHRHGNNNNNTVTTSTPKQRRKRPRNMEETWNSSPY